MTGSIVLDVTQRRVCKRRIARLSIDPVDRNVFVTTQVEPAVHEVASRAVASALFIKPFSGRAPASAVHRAMRSEAMTAP